MEKKAFDLITFGEIMLRLSPPRHARIVDGDIFEKRAGGAELNVASGVALMGLRTGIISRLPQNELGTFIKNRIRFVAHASASIIMRWAPRRASRPSCMTDSTLPSAALRWTIFRPRRFLPRGCSI